MNEFNLENYIQISEDGTEKKVVVNGKKMNVKFDSNKPPAFTLDDKGELTTGTKFTSVAEEYLLRGYSLPLPDNAQVEIFEDHISIGVPVGSMVEPRAIDSKVTGFVEVKTLEVSYLKTSAGNFQALDEISPGNFHSAQTKIFYVYEDGKLKKYFRDRVSVFLNENGAVDFSIFNQNTGDNDKVYLAYLQNEIESNKPTLLVTSDALGSFAPSGFGPVINFLPGNRLGAGVNAQGVNDLSPGKKTLAIQAYDGFVVVRKGAEGKIPEIEMKGGFYGPDKKTFYGFNNQYYYVPNALIGGVTHGDGTIPIKTVLKDTSGTIVPLEIFSTPENGYVMVPPGSMKGPFEYYKGKTVVASNSVAFNQLSPQSRRLYTELLESEQKKLADETFKTGGIAALETQLQQIELQRSPLRASVDLGYCSGTLVGYIGNKPYLLTAAHCVGGVGDTLSVALNSLTNEKYSNYYYNKGGIRGKVVAFSDRSYSSSKYKDLALVELQPNSQQLEAIKKRGYVKIAPSINYAKKEETVLMIGCPGGTNTYRQTNCRVTDLSSSTGTDSIETNVNPYGGQSGGGLFKGRYLVGVVQSGGYRYGGYGNLQSIHKLLKDSGYSALLQLLQSLFRLFVTIG